MEKDIEIEAKLSRKKGLWFIISEIGTIEIDEDLSEDLNLQFKHIIKSKGK